MGSPLRNHGLGDQAAAGSETSGSDYLTDEMMRNILEANSNELLGSDGVGEAAFSTAMEPEWTAHGKGAEHFGNSAASTVDGPYRRFSAGGQSSSSDFARLLPASARLPPGSGATSMLMAANALAQTPSQQVSQALLGQVQFAAAAAEGREMQRRRSLNNSSVDEQKHRVRRSSNGELFRHARNRSNDSSSSFSGPQRTASTRLKSSPFASASSSASPAVHLPFGVGGAGASLGGHSINTSGGNSSGNNVDVNISDQRRRSSASSVIASIAGSFQTAVQIGVAQTTPAASSSFFKPTQPASQPIGDGFASAAAASSSSEYGPHSTTSASSAFGAQQGAHRASAAGGPSSFAPGDGGAVQRSTSGVLEGNAQSAGARDLQSSAMLVSPPNPSSTWPRMPLSPRSEARQQVGNIATSVAVNEYIAQSSPALLLPATVSSSARFGSHINRQYDPSQPFQGVPSTPMMPTPSPAFLPPPDVVMGVRTPFSPSGVPIDTSFVPTYQLAPDEYHALASAAAVVTAALTTANTTTQAARAGAGIHASMAGIQLDSTLGNHNASPATAGTSSGDGSAKGDTLGRDGRERVVNESRALTQDEQLQVTTTLRAWAGLEGTQRQEQARLQLQTLSEKDSGMQFVPPDFARHFQSQLTALAAGYYQKLHADALGESHFAPLETSHAHSAALHDQLQSQYAQQCLRTQHLEDSQKATRDAAAELLQNVGQSQPHDKASQEILSMIAQGAYSTGYSVDSPQVRDQLLQYAHHLYSTGGKQVPAEQIGQGESEKKEEATATQPNEAKAPSQSQPQVRTELHPSLLPLLHTLHKFHPRHLPILLLLSCAYYSQGDLAASLWYNKMILQIDSNYVESMSNIGTTLRALGRWHEAESWWWRAIKLRPGYWDAYENLLGVLCSPQQIPPNEQEHLAANKVVQEGALPSDMQEIAPTGRQPQTTSPRFKEALKLCEFVEGNVLSKRQAADEERLRKVPANGGATATFDIAPVFMPAHLPVAQCPRLQNLFYAKGNLKYVLPELGAVPAAREYEKAVEIVLSTSEDNAYTVRDLVVSTYVVAVLTLGVSLPGTKTSHTAVAAELAHLIGLDIRNAQHVQLAASGQYHILSPGGGILRLVHSAGERLVSALLRMGGGSQLPVLLLLPAACVQLANILFAESHGALPAIVEAGRRANQNVNAIQSTLQQSRSMTSTILLTLAKLMQDASTRAVPGPNGLLKLDGIPPSTSILLPLYYLSITINPAASTANNLGILLSSIPVQTTVPGDGKAGERQQVNGQSVALQFYTYGLQLDPKHPHLYTNFGSLLKDLNHLPEAIQMYEKAIECNPKFDVALANLGNAIKDQGRTQESVQYYRRAVEVNPNFPEALCGLVNALLAICDWQDVYEDDDEGKKGLMARIMELLDRQLDEGAMYGAGAFSGLDRPVEEWANQMAEMYGKDARYRDAQLKRFQALAALDTGSMRESLKINEGSFAIRLVERAARRTQRQWYVDTYGQTTVSQVALPPVQPSATDVNRYARIALPSCLGTPSVPSILPFHCFTLKLTPRQIRLISHRTALRISQTTLAQPWMPSHVYPPPAPPAPRIKVAYISSDFNNHPLAHLMQSVFGMHDRTRFEVFLYATTPSDQSPYRKKIEREAEHFVDVSSWTNQAVIAQVLQDGIHIGVNLSGFTKGARNEIFAARPFPLSIHYMGFAGGLAASWNDYSVVDPVACPPSMTSADVWRHPDSKLEPRLTDFAGDRDPEALDESWVYPEKFIYMPESYFVTDHRQGFREPEQRKGVDGHIVQPHKMTPEEAWREEEEKRWRARKEMWPSLPDDFVILSDFNQLYKLEPTVFKLWLRILVRVPNSILWLLRFPAAGESHLLEYARKLYGDAVASRVIFTDVAPKDVHIHRGRIADLFLDTLECGAHTTSADILWSGTPVLTWPRHEHKMASRVAASIVAATQRGKNMIVHSERDYEDRAVELISGISYTYVERNGRALDTVEGEKEISADAFMVNTSSSSAKGHTPKSTASPGRSAAARGKKSSVPTEHSHAPAPANVNQIAKEGGSQGQNTKAQDPLPVRSTIKMSASGIRAPEDAVSRRAHGELADLRKELFLSRDSNPLFDTPRWVRQLESGFVEAWERWVKGIDMEESAEWDALPADHPVKRSGHIWVPAEEKR